MAATSPLGLSSTRPLCAPPYYDSPMSERLFKTEDAREQDARASAALGRWRRYDHDHDHDHDHHAPPLPAVQSAVTAADWRRFDECSYRADPRRQPLPLPTPTPHDLRYGSSFPYRAVVARERELLQPRRSFQQETEDDQYARQHAEGEPSRRGMSSIQCLLEEQRRTGRDREEHNADRHAWRDQDYRPQQQRDEPTDAGCRGPMPSLGAIIQRSSFPVDHRDQDREPSWQWRAEDLSDGSLARDEFAARRSMDDVRAGSARHSLSLYLYDRQTSLPGLRRLPSLTERRSLSPTNEFASLRGQSSVSALARVASDISMHEYSGNRSVHASASRLRSTSYSSPRDTTRLHVPPRHISTPQNWSSPARAAATEGSLSADSPAKRSRASSEEGGSDNTGEDAAAAPPARKKKKRKVRICTTPECDKLVVDHGVCIRHGGGKRCNVDGCDCRAQNKGLCWKHGGYTICQIDSCDKRAKSRGMCWSHGGGTQCKTDGCEKIAVSRGRCWAHGGGKRCKLPDCQKPAALRMDNYCTEHYAANRATVVSTATARRGLDTQTLYELGQ